MSYKEDPRHLHQAFSDLAGVIRTRSHAGDLMANQAAGKIRLLVLVLSC